MYIQVDKGSYLLIGQDKKRSFEDLVDRLHKRAPANLWDNSSKRTTASSSGCDVRQFLSFSDASLR